MTRTITINGCPNHYSLAAGTLNPNVAVKGTYTLSVPMLDRDWLASCRASRCRQYDPTCVSA